MQKYSLELTYLRQISVRINHVVILTNNVMYAKNKLRCALSTHSSLLFVNLLSMASVFTVIMGYFSIR